MKILLCVIVILLQTACTAQNLKVVFVTGDEEYRSEESMTMLAEITARETGAEVHVCYSVDSLGNIDPNNTKHIQGLEELADADLMVIFTRYRALPSSELKYITDFVDSGKPIVGFRTSTHAFKYKEDSSMFHMNDEWPVRIFGQQWITHHGHFHDGNQPLTEVKFMEGVSNEILNGVEPFLAYSWLYHVDGGDWSLPADAQSFLKGTSLESKHEKEGRLDQFAMTQPVAWTKGNVFFTTLGHPYDFKNESMRKLAINGILWALKKDIPKEGVNVDLVRTYEPNNSGFGEKFKKGMRPATINPR